MNRKRDLVNIAESYSGILDQISKQALLEEERKAKKVSAKKGIATGSFEVVSGKNTKKGSAKSEPFVGKKSGPQAADGFKTDIIDTKNSKKKDNFYTPERFSQLKVEKTEAKSINNCMSNKSTFDKLYENVMGGGDLESSPENLDSDPGLDGAPGDDLAGGDELGGGDDLKSKVAQALDLLNQINDELNGGAGDEGDDLSDDAAGEDFGDESGDNAADELAGEATDIKELGDKSASLKKVGGKANVVGDETSKMVDGKEGDGKVTDKVTGNEKGKEGKSTPVTGKANVVSTSKTSKVGGSLFAK